MTIPNGLTTLAAEQEEVLVLQAAALATDLQHLFYRLLIFQGQIEGVTFGEQVGLSGVPESLLTGFQKILEQVVEGEGVQWEDLIRVAGKLSLFYRGED